jgi:ribosomal protein S13
MDPLRWLRIEADLKREMRENIAHQRMIGSYVGKRHAMGLPVRGRTRKRTLGRRGSLTESSGTGSTTRCA